MLKKMGEAVARVARKVNETVESGSDTLDVHVYLHRLPSESLQHFKAVHLSYELYQRLPVPRPSLPAYPRPPTCPLSSTDVPVEKLAAMPALRSINLRFNPLSAEVRVIAPPLIKFDMLMSPEGARAPPP
ncbi:leucine-rich repeat-containing protein 20 isoform X1 [Leptonychotes weddellii]|uniref:Leucine-rich repeat-containing protein 20 isoform X1 n=1 Tax=Leptonychotes weddellii TaxID=9713 RepID=A0A7F8RWA5_LEPWE|nr:leucine-rich repeat-containing protein 20 isoform X1 [Leptonychotes weddellii]